MDKDAKKRDKFPLELKKVEEPAQKSAAIVEDNKKSNKQITTKKSQRGDEVRQKSTKKHKHKDRHLQKAPTKLESEEKREKE